MDPFIQALIDLPNLIADYHKAMAELAEARKDLEAQKDDKYVSLDWVCRYFNVSKKTALIMLADEKMFVHGRHIKRFKRSDILRFAERHKINVKDIHE